MKDIPHSLRPSQQVQHSSPRASADLDLDRRDLDQASAGRDLGPASVAASAEPLHNKPWLRCNYTKRVEVCNRLHNHNNALASN